MLTIFSKDIIVALCQLHPRPLDLVPPLIFYYQPKHIFVLDRTLIAQALTTTPHLSSGGLSVMVYEHLSKCLISKDPSLRFSELFQVTFIIARGDIFRLMALVLGVNKLLAMVKDSYYHKQGVSSTY
jgi:hypothetical protein